MLPILKSAPIFIYPGGGAYDGFYYAQVATDPSLGDPKLSRAVDDLGYRARRIFLSAVAWAIGNGDPVRTVRAYAWLNVGGWLLLAALLWRLLPTHDTRANLAWIGILGSAGVMLSVRLSLPDLPALLFLAAGLFAVERGRWLGAGLLLGVAALSRETALLGCVALLPRARWSFETMRKPALACALAVLPLALWVAWVVWQTGRSGAGINNLAPPGLEWWHKLQALITAQSTESNRALAIASLLGHFALAIQATFLVLHRDWRCPWWRAGAAAVLLFLCLGPAVWGIDLPGASVRVLLPLTLAFNVVAVRRKTALAWLLAGNLAVTGGVVAVQVVQHDPHELAGGQAGSGTFVVRAESGWYGTERLGDLTWTWSKGEGGVRIDLWPKRDAVHEATIELKALSPRHVEIQQDERILWSGPVDETLIRVSLGNLTFVDGQARLYFRSNGPPVRPSASDSRELTFAVFGIELR